MANNTICDWEITMKNIQKIIIVTEKSCNIIEAIKRCEPNIRVFDYEIINIRKI